MKKVLTGFCNNITDHKEKIKWWVESFRKHSDAEVVLIAANMNDGDRRVLSDLNVNYVEVTENDTWYINNKRLRHTKEFLESSDGDVFLITDVFDVLFQSDPFQKMDLDNYDVFISKEGIKVVEEPWNGDVINKVFPDQMDYMCENSPNDHNIKDQAALIILVKDNWIDNLKNFSLDEGWAMHCQSAGPTYFFEAWGLKNSILRKGYGIPELRDDGFVYTQSGIKYDMVHQFNRVEEWKNIITKEYE